MGFMKAAARPKLQVATNSLLICGCAGFVVLLVVLIWRGDRSPWTGFGAHAGPKGEYQRGKTLWDWLGLLVIPGSLALGGWLFSQSRENSSRELESDRLREEAFQRYLDRMAELMLKEGLRSSNVGSEVRVIARARTLTVLRELDEKRKATLLRFLYEANLIIKNRMVVEGPEETEPQEPRFLECTAVIGLNDADLSNVHLPGVDLDGVDLHEADLGKSNLHRASLSATNLARTDLHRADLRRAYLVYANLENATLNHADLSEANLCQAKLDGVKLHGADLRKAQLDWADLDGAELHGADLRDAVGLTQRQLDLAKGDANTKLPVGVTRPESWSTAAAAWCHRAVLPIRVEKNRRPEGKGKGDIAECH
jgi:uncharacterized protein YjbI with pentapeptide repeats